MKKIKESYKIFVPTDKLRNSYLLRKDECKKFSKNIIKTYTKKNMIKVYDISNKKSIVKQHSMDNHKDGIYKNES